MCNHIAEIPSRSRFGFNYVSMLNRNPRFHVHKMQPAYTKCAGILLFSWCSLCLCAFTYIFVFYFTLDYNVVRLQVIFHRFGYKFTHHSVSSLNE